jgi:hypothetical protein
VWLGWRDRCRFVIRKRAAVIEQQNAFFGYMATIIQKWLVEIVYSLHCHGADGFFPTNHRFRGYFSRKYKQDYYARKRWVQQIAQKVLMSHTKFKDELVFSPIQI